VDGNEPLVDFASLAVIPGLQVVAGSEPADSEPFQKYFCLVHDNRRLPLDKVQVSAYLWGGWLGLSSGDV